MWFQNRPPQTEDKILQIYPEPRDHTRQRYHGNGPWSCASWGALIRNTQHHSPVFSPTWFNLNLITRKQTNQAVGHSRKWPRLLNVSVLRQEKAEDTPRWKMIKETWPPNAMCDSNWTFKLKVEAKDRTGTYWGGKGHLQAVNMGCINNQVFGPWVRKIP